ncbi:ABC-type sugar transport system permease subunit [Paenibacillus sp. V4I9]|uniref:hypothetical protein n=1 Tax=Paenibacillus sp. V4I9 TaxID=3042308 RepID=UPI0027885412|nr:hypothetical protein [Paenibacillus sp. V4I9]MDQ0886522.1 ABC-type sugar transport system permease subunit [Paenibacillus sp. V4I9]
MLSDLDGVHYRKWNFDLTPTVGGPDGAALTPIWYMYDSSFNGGSFQYGKGAAIAYSTFLVIALFSVLSIKWMNREETLDEDE